MRTVHVVTVAAWGLLAGCSHLQLPPGPDRGVDGVACVGTIEAGGWPLTDAPNPTLLAQAQLATDKGGVCAARVVAVTAPVTLYRVFDASKPYTKFGGWWSMQRPGASREAYRAANAICPEWSPLDRVVACQVRPGTQLVLGTTQSAVCADGTVLPKTGATQVFVPNDGRVGIVHVGACGDEAAWP